MTQTSQASSRPVSDPALDDSTLDEEFVKSKSQRKRDMHALQDLASTLVELPKERLAKVPLPEKLQLAIREAQHIRSHEGRRRQLQYLGKLMRQLDETEVAAIRHTLDVFSGASQAETAKLHRIERLRTTLLASDDAVTEFFSTHPHADVQALRTLIRNARKEQRLQQEQPDKHIPPKHYRELFQAIKSILDYRLPDSLADTPTIESDPDA